jgi:hypothetical protein
MKTFSIITTFAAAAASLLAFASPASAQEATYDYPQAIVSAKSRADVRAELLQARADGLIVAGEAADARLFDATPAVRGTLQRRAALALPSLKAPAASANVRSELVPTQFEPHSFDGRITVADGAVVRRVR